MYDITRDLQTPTPFANCHIFSDASLPWSVKYFMQVRKTLVTRHSAIQRRSDLIIPRMRAAIVQSKSFAYVGPSDWTPPAPGITIPVRRDDLRLSCFLTQALMPLESIANFNDAIHLITLHYIFSYLWVENHIFNKFRPK